MKINTIKTMQENLEGRGLKLSQTEVREVLKAVDETIFMAGKELEVKEENGKMKGESVNMGSIVIAKNHKPERKGVSKLQEGKETEWVSPAHNEVVLKLRNPLRDSLKEF